MTDHGIGERSSEISLVVTRLRRCFRVIILAALMIGLPLSVEAQTELYCGETISGAITRSGEAQHYLFTAEPDDRVIIMAREISGNLNPLLELYDPGGRLSSIGSSPERKLNAAGTYSASLKGGSTGNETGSYPLYYQQPNNPWKATPIDYEETIPSTVATEHFPWRISIFVRSANDVVTLRVKPARIA